MPNVNPVPPALAAVPADDTSGNLSKHTRGGRAHRYLLDRFHATARALLAPVTPQRVLDAGCGEGFGITYLFPDTTAQVVGVDLRPHALTFARTLNPQHSFATGSVFSLPFRDGQFDLVLCMEVLEHLDDPAAALHELRRLSSAWLLLSVPNEPLFMGANFLRGKNVQAWGNDPEHINHWSTGAFLDFVHPVCDVVAYRQSFPWTLVLCRVPSS